MGRGRTLGLLSALVIAAFAAGCGSDDDASSGIPTLSFYTFTAGSGGAFERAVQTCNQRAGDRYQIAIEELPPNADDQREQLARRLAAQDSSIDIMALDLIFTAEFAEAEWILAFPQELASQVRQASIASTVESGTYEDRLYAAPYTSNTQLLWYRTDRVQEPPDTWAEMIERAEEIGPQGTIQVQGQQAEGFVVWFTSLLFSAGGQVLNEEQGTVALAPEPTQRALEVMRNVATSSAADPSLPTQAEDQNRLAFETGNSTFMVNYPFIYPSAEENAPEVFRNIGAARYPRVVPDRPSSPPLGGLNLAVGAFSEHPQEAFDATMCLRRPENQLLATELGGLPPTQADLFDSRVVRDAYPGFADLMLESIEAATPRPATPAYADVSLAIRQVLHPPREIQPEQAAEELRETVERALNSEGLF